MSKTYMVWYSTGEYGKAWFTADNLEHAHDLLAKVEQGDLSYDDLPDYEFNPKGGDGWEWSDLTEMN